MKKIFIWSVLSAVTALVIFSCQWENKAEDERTIWVSPFEAMRFAPHLSNALTNDGVYAYSCCGRTETGSGDGGPDNAINGNTNGWWHSNWGMPLATNDGHLADTTALTTTTAFRQSAPALAAGNPVSKPEGGNYATVGEYVTANIPYGAHWITLALPDTVPNLASVGYQRRPGGGNGAMANYEIWVSDAFFGWDTSNATLVSKGNWGGLDQVYANFVPVSAKYVQIRGRFTTATGDKWGGAANITLRTSDDQIVLPTKSDSSNLLTAIIRGTALLKQIPVNTTTYTTLTLVIENGRLVLDDKTLSGATETSEILAAQGAYENAANAIFAVIDRINPPRIPTEEE